MNVTIAAWLSTQLNSVSAQAGTVHQVSDGELILSAAENIPETVVDAIRRVPSGKGMAGLAWFRNEPIQICNLQHDDNEAIQPGARSVQAGAAVALPVHDPDGVVRAIVGFAFSEERALTSAEAKQLQAIAETLPKLVP